MRLDLALICGDYPRLVIVRDIFQEIKNFERRKDEFQETERRISRDVERRGDVKRRTIPGGPLERVKRMVRIPRRKGGKGGKWQGRVAPDPAKGDGEKSSRADG